MKETERQARWWKWAAWTAPFVALAILLGEIILGIDTQPTSFIIVVTFIATSVFWWWWAISKIVYMIKCSYRMEDNFEHIKKEIKQVRKDVGDWQRRESQDD
jgi:hypothetical protein